MRETQLRTLRWTVVIPVKSFPAAKSRLAPVSVDAAAHRRLVEAIRSDTIAAARDAADVARVLLVTDAVTGADGPAPTTDDPHLAQTRPGLNGALRDGAEHAAKRWPDDGIAMLVGDLPGLRPHELTDTLAAAATAGHGFVADAAGTGTTLLAAVPGELPSPQFGTGSAARHATLATALPAGPGLRHDVDTADDLDTTVQVVGVGPATAHVLADTAVTRSPSVGMICS